ncbi:hypothetical protein ES705_26231 [subsurface metagenome]
MKYTFRELTIEKLVNIIDQKKVDLNPEYQRNFIWSPRDQSDLIDTILKKYPIPNFFMYEDSEEAFEMVDGQQRSKTIFRFVKGLIQSSKDSGKLNFTDCDQEGILNYKLPFVIMRELDSKDSLKDFYVLINKKGKHLNIPEVNKSEFFDTNFLKFANELLNYQNLINLDLFTEAARIRMNDRAYVEELLGYLKLGIKDKKKTVEVLFENDITNNERIELRKRFILIIDIIERLNRKHPIKATRYKQKNDFYTLFNFVNENIDETEEVLEYQYRVLIILDGTDGDGKQLIRPSNEDCDALRKYADNCVTQSNSKDAREYRLSFFNAILKNSDLESNPTLSNLLDYLGEIYEPESVLIKEVGSYKLLDVSQFQ